jgi:NAD(P)H-hydrate epimerase
MRQLVRVVTSVESAVCDASAIDAGVPSRALMQRAGAAAAAEIALRHRDAIDHGVLVLAGPGNNGGDAWVVARALAATGVRVRVVEPVVASTADARAERALALDTLAAEQIASGAVPADFDRGEAIVVDGIIGTGHRAATGLLVDVIDRARAVRARGAAVVAIDIPTNVDASTGEARGTVLPADTTLTFGTVKRGHLVNRDACGTIVVLDIGLGRHAARDDLPQLVDEAWVAAHVPAIAATAHKGTRKKLAIVGGGAGMAGAVTLAARAALRSGAGMVKVVVAPASVPVMQETEPHALAAAWPHDDDAFARDVGGWADALVIGPGLGRGDESRALLERTLRLWRGPVLLDADAITLFEKRAPELGALLRGRPALLTPHAVEFSRLSGIAPEDVLARRFDVGVDVAGQVGAAVLLKGVPTVIAAPDGRRLVTASGTPALATGGSGDLLSGIAGTMLAQLGDPLVAGAVAAWIHGRAAERVPSSAGTGRGVRGITLDDVVIELRDGWTFDARPTRAPVLVELPAVGESAS